MIGNVDLEEFKRGRIAVNCVTKEDAQEFLRGLHEVGFRWSSEASLCNENKHFNHHTRKTCYSVDEDWRYVEHWKIGYSDIAWHEEQGYTIIKYEKERKEMKFGVLKEGWIARTRSGLNVVVRFHESLNGVNLCSSLTDSDEHYEYREDLTNTDFKACDIMKVWDTDGGEMTLVWERKEPTELELLENQLKELQDKIAELKKGGK